MHIATYMMTCRERANLRTETLQDLARSDWTGPVNVVEDDGRQAGRGARQVATCKRLLELAASKPGDLILFLEDDTTFNRHLFYNLTTWPLLLRSIQREHFFVSLYNPGIPPKSGGTTQEEYEVVPQRVYGSQAILMRPATARLIIQEWDAVRALADIRMSRAAATVTPIYYHRPSLVDHMPAPSMLETGPHCAFDFEHDWRRTPAVSR